MAEAECMHAAMSLVLLPSRCTTPLQFGRSRLDQRDGKNMQRIDEDCNLGGIKTIKRMEYMVKADI